MINLQKFVSTLLVATFVVGNVACLCEAKAAVKVAEAATHAHHQTQAGTGNTEACPHANCNGNCATLPSISADKLVVTAVARSDDHDESATVPLFPADQILFGGSPIYSYPAHAPPALQRATPVSRFDRILA